MWAKKKKKVNQLLPTLFWVAKNIWWSRFVCGQKWISVDVYFFVGRMHFLPTYYVCANSDICPRKKLCGHKRLFWHIMHEQKCIFCLQRLFALAERAFCWHMLHGFLPTFYIFVSRSADATSNVWAETLSRNLCRCIKTSAKPLPMLFLRSTDTFLHQ